MRTFYNKIAVFSVLGLLLAACGTSNNVVSGHLISKRKVNKGFFINHSKDLKSVPADEQEARQPFIQYSEEEAVELAVTDAVPANEAQASDAAPMADLVLMESSAEQEELVSANPELTQKSVKEKPAAPQELRSDKKTKAELRQAKKEIKKELREDGSRLLLLVIICIILPPLAVFLHEGSWNTTCWINLLLTILGYLPGLIHGLIVILRD